MNAKYPGYCKICKSAFDAGTAVSSFNGGWAHSKCVLSKKTVKKEGTCQLLHDGRFFTFEFDYDPEAIDIVKNLPRESRRWNPDRKRWEVCVDEFQQLVDGLRRRRHPLHDELVGSRYAPVHAILAESEAKKVATFEASSAKKTDMSVQIPVPDGKSYFPFQIAGIKFLLDHQKTLLGDSMGLGKTIQVAGLLNVCKELKKVLIICPASLRINWKRELEAWLTRPLTIGIATSKEWPVTDIVVINYDILEKHATEIAASWDALICDEAHYLKNPKAKRTGIVLGNKATRPIKATRAVFLTGTPIPNRPVELWPLVRGLDRSGLGSDWEKFVLRYCNASQTQWGWDVSGASNLEELQTKLRSTIMIRRLKEDVLAELPKKLRQVVVVPANGSSSAVESETAVTLKLEKETERLERAAILALVEENDLAYKAAVEALTSAKKLAFVEMAKARHNTALAKTDAVIEHVRMASESVGKVVVFAHHRDVIEKLCDGLSDLGVVRLTGEDSMESRQSAVDSFQKNPNVRVFVGNIRAAGVGITLTASSTVIFAEIDWVPGNMSQCEDRVCRIGQTAASIHVVHVVVDGSIDAKLAKTIVRKQSVADAALDGACSKPSIAVLENETSNTIDEITSNDDIDTSYFDNSSDMRQRQNPQVPTTKPQKKEAVAERQFSKAELKSILEALQQISGVCDGARQRDGHGFSKTDSEFGKSLSTRRELTQKQGAYGFKLVRKYRRQVPEEILLSLGISK